MFWIILAVVVLCWVLWWAWPTPMAKLAQAWERHRGRLHAHQDSFQGVEWHVLEGGCGEPLVLLHGFNGDAHHFARAARHLSDHFRIIAPDLPGFGQTKAEVAVSHRIEDVAKRLLDWLDHRHIDTFYLGGNSMGGYIATAMAKIAPSRVRALWLLAPGGIRSAPLSPVLQEVSEDRHNPLVVRDFADFNRLLDYCFVQRPWMPTPLLRHLAKQAASTCQHSLEIFDAMLHDSADLEEMAKQLPTPALIVWGEQDQVLHPQGAVVLADILPNNEVIAMPQIGHLPMLEAPRESAEAFLAFAERLSRSPLGGCVNGDLDHDRGGGH